MRDPILREKKFLTFTPVYSVFFLFHYYFLSEQWIGSFFEWILSRDGNFEKRNVNGKRILYELDFFFWILNFENGNKDFDVRIFCNVLILFFCLESRNFENGISK